MSTVKLIEAKWGQWVDQYAFACLRISIGTIYTLFGLLKFFPQYSPAEQLAADTICIITFDVLSGNAACMTLAIIETMIGLLLITNFKPKATIILTIWHMCCTFLPLVILPKYVFSENPFSFSIVGQYIFKNLVILSALLVLYKNTNSVKADELMQTTDSKSDSD